ncbi:hypothetical protein Acr_00g0032200 [Actinidia rufa]|uniref:Uncharacterized protein n=1 Tax=Actinidia rufa TaxID=165716 RepID=A0A7J0DFJ0_9ERIC|nr:hypothetical protein Acr_00g0032200 [Actinidia rufa]
MNPKVVKARVGPEINNTDCPAYDLGEKGALFHRHPSQLSELSKRVTRLSKEEDDHPAKTTGSQYTKGILEVEGASAKVVVMAMMEGLCLGPLFDSLSKNIPETQSALQSKADKYITAEELAEAKRRKREKENYKRKEPESKRVNYRDEVKNRSNRDVIRKTNDRCPCTTSRLPNIKRGYLKKYVTDHPHPNSPERRYGDNRPTAGEIQVIHEGFGLEGCSSSSRKRHVREACGRAEDKFYNLSSPLSLTHKPTTFTNDDLRGLHLPHDYALVISATIANFNM